jgi:HAE1 family hydrophobic/amphiphilic exporter-1
MLSLFFIRRPIFAGVISIVIVLLGSVALMKLPIARYPDLAPPTISVSASYPGADASTVADTVATTIEKQVNGVEGMIYMSSVSANDGSMNLTVTFEPGTDLDTANVLVQNRVSLAEPRLPAEVMNTGVSVKKKSTDIVMFVALSSPDGTYDASYLSNFANLRIKDDLLRVAGVGDVLVYGAGEFSMRIWLDPDQLRVRNLSASEVTAAIRQQNVQVAAGRVGAAPAPEGTPFEYVLSAKGRLVETSEFEQIIVATGKDGQPIRVGDVARVELGSDVYSFNSTLNGAAATSLAIYQVPGSNLMDVANGVRDTLATLSSTFPKDVEYKVVYNSTWVVSASIKEVIITLFATVILVILTVYLFLQNFRATLIPTITIPVSLIGTFSVLLALDFSLNTLTLFGLVLVIGIVVDDAILVVENTSVHLEKGRSGKEAAAECMKEVTGPIMATTLVLLAVFVPTAMMSGITGTMFKQFAITISIATVFSSINALTLAPALCGVLLKPGQPPAKGFFKLFNKSVAASNKFYQGLVRLALKGAVIGVLLFVALIYVSMKGFESLPTGFVPQEDEGYCMVSLQLPDGATLDRTDAVMAKVQEIVNKTPGVVDCLSISGYSLIDGATAVNSGFCVVVFEQWDERKTPELKQSGILAAMQREFSAVQEAIVFAFPMPSLPGVGTTGGFTYMLQDLEGGGLDQLASVATELIAKANQDPAVAGARTTFRASVPQIFVNIDRDQVMLTGTPLSSVFDTLQVYLGSLYVNDFTLFGRVFKVVAQADAPYRKNPGDINKLAVKGADGRMIPLGAVASIDQTLGPQNIMHFNMMTSVQVLGDSSPGHSSGQAMAALESISAKTLPQSMGYSWSALSYQEKQAATGLVAIFAFAVLMVYLLLAAQYESWTLPLSVCLSVPAALFGAVIAVKLRGMENNVYTQIGLILLIAMSTKTAILLTEFASVKRKEGMSIFDSAVESVKLRFRAVLMTAISFILGVIPLVIASGAGAASRQILGTAVLGGMLAATVLSLIIVPMMYFVIQTIVEKISGEHKKTEPVALESDAE